MDDYEKSLYEQLRMLREAYEKQAAPIIERLVQIENTKPPKPFFLTNEQVRNLGLLVKSDNQG